MHTTLLTANVLMSASADLHTLSPHLLPHVLDPDMSVLAAGPPHTVATLPQVIRNLQAWIMGILATVATLYLVIGGLRYVAANGDPAAIEQAKGAVRAALIGYSLAVLAPVILRALQGILGV